MHKILPRFSCIALALLVLWLLIDFIDVKSGQIYIQPAFAYVWLIFQYFFWLWGSSILFKGLPKLRRWLFQLMIAAILWLLFIMLNTVIIMGFHVWIGGRL